MEHEYDGDAIRVRFDPIEPDVMPPAHQVIVRDVLTWCKEKIPVWFSWLEIA